VLVIIAIAVVMAALFAASYSLALGRATPHHITVGLVGRPAQLLAPIGVLQRATHGALTFRPYNSAATARHAIGQQATYAALVPVPGRPQLLISSASGASVARVLEQAAGEAQGTGQPVRVIDLHPLPSADPQGLTSFYVTLAASFLGFVTMLQLRANAAGLSLRGWLASIAVLAITGGLVLALVADPAIGALRGPFPELWLALGAEVAVAAVVCSTMIVLIGGRWAIIPTWLLFIILGNTSSGGAVAPPLLPQPYAFVGRFLPPARPWVSSAPLCTSATSSTWSRWPSRPGGWPAVLPRW
jgi:hypothetical protein